MDTAAAGAAPCDKPGAALVNDVSLGFGGLREFGEEFWKERLQLKVRESSCLHDVALVDSPGMIDSTASQWSEQGDAADGSLRDRQYEYFKVIEWFAARADVILFFFDPANPGTTLETLQALKGLLRWEYKVHIILNKVDTMTSFHDLARVYGTLCWNLSKMIPRYRPLLSLLACHPPEVSYAHPCAAQKGHPTGPHHLPSRLDAARGPGSSRGHDEPPWGEAHGQDR